MPTRRALNPDYLAALYQMINTSPFVRHLPMRIDQLTWDTSTIVLDVEENPAARTARPDQVTDYRAAEAVRQSGFLDRLPKD